MKLICDHYGIRSTRLVLLLGLAPAVAYYSVGALKELPTVAALTAFFFHFLRRDTLRWMAWASVMFLFRYQFVAVLFAFLVIDKLFKDPLKISFYILLAAAMAYPLFASVEVLSADAASIYREEATQSTGAVVESLREIPVLSAVAVAVRVCQSVLEPLIAFGAGLTFHEDWFISSLAIAYLSSLLLWLPSWARTFRRIFRSLRGKSELTRDANRLYALVLLFVVPVGGFSFIHHRYLFPVTALVLVGGALGKVSGAALARAANARVRAARVMEESEKQKDQSGNAGKTIP